MSNIIFMITYFKTHFVIGPLEKVKKKNNINLSFNKFIGLTFFLRQHAEYLKVINTFMIFNTL